MPHNPSTTFMLFSVVCIICEGPKVDASRSQSVTATLIPFVNIRHFFNWKTCIHLDSTLEYFRRQFCIFSMQVDYIFLA